MNTNLRKICINLRKFCWCWRNPQPKYHQIRHLRDFLFSYAWHILSIDYWFSDLDEIKNKFQAIWLHSHVFAAVVVVVYVCRSVIKDTWTRSSQLITPNSSQSPFRSPSRRSSHLAMIPLNHFSVSSIFQLLTHNSFPHIHSIHIQNIMRYLMIQEGFKVINSN